MHGIMETSTGFLWEVCGDAPDIDSLPEDYLKEGTEVVSGLPFNAMAGGDWNKDTETYTPA